MATFPPVGIKQDSRYFSETSESKTIASETDGGYKYARTRHSRRPRRTFKTGFTKLTIAQKDVLLSFFEAHGGYVIFQYFHPLSAVSIDVRFLSSYAPQFSYAGIGEYQAFNLSDVSLVEV